MANILLKVMGDGTDAKKTLDETSAEVDRFGKKQATAQIKVDAAQAKRDIAEVVAEAKLIPREETIRIRVAGEQAKLEELTTRLKALEQQLTSTAEAGGATDPLIQRMGAVSRQIDDTRLRIKSLAHDFDAAAVEGERFTSHLSSGLRGVRQGMLGLAEGIASIVPLLGQFVATGIAKLGELAENLIPDAAEGFAGLGVSLLSLGPGVLILGAVVAGVAALVSSLALAVAGVAALGIAFLAALGPIALVLGAAVLKFKAAATAQANLTQATQAQKQAVTALHTAQQAESTQRIAALQAEKQSVLALHDAQDELADSKLNVKQTALDIQTARQALAAFKQTAAGGAQGIGGLAGRATNVDVHGNLGQTQSGRSSTSPGGQLLQLRQFTLNLAEAVQSHKDALDGEADAQSNANQAQATANDFAKKGLLAYQPYAAAVQQTYTVTMHLHTANLKLAADAKAMQGASGILGAYAKLKGILSELFGPAVKAVFAGVAKAVETFAKHPKEIKELATAFQGVGRAIGGAFVYWAKMMSKPDNVKLIKQLIGDAAKLTTSWSTGMGSLFKIVGQVAVAAMPALLSIVKSVGTKFADIAEHPKQITTFIDNAITATRKWWGVLAGILKTLSSIVQIASAPIRGWENVGKSFINPGGKGAAPSQEAFESDPAEESAWLAYLTAGTHGNVSLLSPQSVLQAAAAQFAANWKRTHSHAAGGIAVNPTMGIFGEAGPEALIPLTPQTFDNLGERIAESFLRYIPRMPAFEGASPAAATGWTGDMHNHFGSAPIDPDHFAAVTQRRIMRAIHGLGGGVG